eukprot:1142135-Pelagomonas_calceolata.AAC.4
MRTLWNTYELLQGKWGGHVIGDLDLRCAYIQSRRTSSWLARPLVACLCWPSAGFRTLDFESPSASTCSRADRPVHKATVSMSYPQVLTKTCLFDGLSMSNVSRSIMSRVGVFTTEAGSLCRIASLFEG